MNPFECPLCWLSFFMYLMQLCSSSTHSAKILTTHLPFRDGKTLAILGFDSDGRTLKDCNLFDLEKNPMRANDALSKLKSKLTEINFKQMMNIIAKCRQMSIVTSSKLSKSVDTHATNVTDLNSFWRGIIPGTKWCGLGDEARDYNDIGQESSVDNCCRAHDHCPIRIKPFRFDYGVVNLSVYTKSHCDCDDDFYHCLKSVNTPLADMLGNFYFNVVQFGCMQESNKSCDGLSCLELPRSSDSSPRMEFVYTRNLVF